MTRKQRLAVVVAGLMLILALVGLISHRAQGQIQLHSETGPMPVPVYVGQISEGELNQRVGCKYFKDANCSKCGLSHYRSTVMKTVTKENFEELRSWFFKAMREEVSYLPAHKVIEAFMSVLALSAWRDFACGTADREKEFSTSYIYIVYVVEEWGQKAVYRMFATGGVEKLTFSDRQVRLLLFQ